MGEYSIPLVRQSDAAAIIAGKDEEIAGLHAEVERLTKSLADANEQLRLKDGKIDHITRACEESEATIAQQAERVAGLERETGRIIGWQLKTIEKQSAALAKAREALKYAVWDDDGCVQEALAAIDAPSSAPQRQPWKESNDGK